MELLRFVGFNKLVLLPQHFFRDGPLFFWRGGGSHILKKIVCKAKKPKQIKLFADMKMKK